MTGRIPDLLAKRAELGAERVALEDYSSGRTLTFAELDARASRLAGLLAGLGVGRGERVAYLSRNRPSFFELLFACARIDAILVPLNWRMPAAELQGLIDDCEPRLVIHGGAEGEVAARLRPGPALVDLDGDFETLVEQADPVEAPWFWRTDSTWYLLYTSGTTGQPKGVVYTYGMALANHVSIGACIGLTPKDRTACFLPLFHTAGINLHALPTLFAGGRVIVIESFAADRLIELVEQERIDTIFGVPTVYQALIDDPRFAAAPLGRIRHWGCGGAPLPDRLVLRYRALGIRVCNGMGMTETGPTAFLVDPADAWNHIGSVGKPQLLSSVRIVGPEGREVGEGEVGDLQFAGPGVTPGYWRNEEATRAAFTPDGWLRSGDLARRDGDGFYYIEGRRKEMFISGGENVYPVEVENVLTTHPEVAEAAVVAEEDEHWGEVGRAFVRREAGSGIDADALARYCRSRLAGYKVPRAFEFVEDFPRTSAGKIQKHRLRPCSPPTPD